MLGLVDVHLNSKTRFLSALLRKCTRRSTEALLIPIKHLMLARPLRWEATSQVPANPNRQGLPIQDLVVLALPLMAEWGWTVPSGGLLG